MTTHDNRVVCHVTHDRAGVTVWLVDGQFRFASAALADEFVRSQGLTVVSAAELRDAVRGHRPVFAEEALRRDPVGRDDPEVATWKRAARLQERFLTAGDGWAWWTRFCATNPAATCADIAHMLTALAADHPDERRNGLPIDWLELLRRVMAESSSTSVGTLRAALCRELAGDEWS